MYLQRYYRSDDGLRLAARDYPGPGPGAPVLLCLPGLTRNCRDFEGLACELGRHYRVICPDQRGRGLSERDPDPARYRPDRYVADMFTLLDLLGVAQCSVIGTSLGGLMAMLMAALQPARLRAVVLNDVGPELEPRGVARIQAYVRAAPGDAAGGGPVDARIEAALARLRAINAAQYPDFGEHDWLQLFMATHVIEGERALADFDPAIARGLEGGSAAPQLWPLFEALRGRPVLVLRGALSDILSAETVAEMQHRMPTLRALEIEGRGHAPTLDEPAARAAIAALLSEACAEAA